MALFGFQEVGVRGGRPICKVSLVWHAMVLSRYDMVWLGIAKVWYMLLSKKRV